MSPELEPYFVSTHAPIERLRDDKRGGELTEHELYERLFHSERGNVFTIVHGDPGTGKSHLIRWLHLQCERDIDSGRLPDVVPVLVQRRTGSLKDALTQIVEQLPPAFERYLKQVREAIGNLSDDRARHALANAIQLQLLEGGSLSPGLRHLNEFCGSPGSKSWLVREGGVIDRIVRQLTQESDVLDREALPTFTPEEFSVPLAYRGNNAPSTLDLIDELEFERERGEQRLAVEACSLFNAATRPAVKVMSGLIGAGLRDVFDGVRGQLRLQGKRLALFVEDVSVMASLDDDILNAVEPNPDPELGHLTAVVGMTETGYQRLPENLLGRTTDGVSVGTSVATEWGESTVSLARFAARYLNVARLGDSGVEAVAATRRDGLDIAYSACDRCPVRELCHTTFGSVRFDRTEVGLFPFTERGLQNLFLGLKEDPKKAIRKNPRGLLEHIILPVLRDERQTLLDGEFPRMKLVVELDEPIFWSSFEARYLGGWSAQERTRLRAFSQAWITARTAEEAARHLLPFLPALRFRSFSRDVVLPNSPVRKDGAIAIEGESTASEGPQLGGGFQDGDAGSSTAQQTGPHTERGQRPQEPAELRGVLNEIGRWARGEPMTNDDEPRRLVHELLKAAIPWDNERVPVEVYRTRMADKSYVRFENQRSRLRRGQTFAVDISRSEEARALVEALARWEWQGQRGWGFRDGEMHKRNVSRWLRHHLPRIIGTLQPPDTLDPDNAMMHAVRVLGVAALLRRGSDFPSDRAAIVRELLQDMPSPPPVPIGESDREFLEPVCAAHARVRQFVMSELSAPQGGPHGGVVFIDPLPLLKHARAIHSSPVAERLDREFLNASRFWQPRYAALSASDIVADLPAALGSRRTALLRGLAEARAAILDARIPIDDLEAATKEYCNQVAALLPIQAEQFQMSPSTIDSIRPLYTTRGAAWAHTVLEAELMTGRDDVLGLLTLSVTEFHEAVGALRTAQEFIETLEGDVARHERTLNEDGDPLALLEEIRGALSEIAGVRPPLEVDVGSGRTTP